MVLWNMSIECPLFGTMPRPCLDHVRTMFCLALLPDKPELFNFEDQISMVWSICLLCVYFLGNVWVLFNHAETMFVLTLYPDHLTFSPLSHYDLRLKSIEWPLFETMSLPLLDHARTMLILVLLQDKLKHLNFQDWVNMV